MLNPARSAVIRNMVFIDDRVLLHNLLVVVGGVDGTLIHMRDRGIVGKLVAAPLPA